MLKRFWQALWAVPALVLLFVSPSAGQALSASVLPASRSVAVGTPATVFATIVNGGPGTGIGCRPALATSLPASFSFQTTDPATNQLVGTLNTPVNLPAGAAQSFVLTLLPSAAIPSTTVTISFACTNGPPAPTITNVNTLLFAASEPGGPDIVALATTPSGDGTLNVGGTNDAGAFAVATANLGAGTSITASADTGGTNLPLSAAICQTDRHSGACVTPTTGGATLRIDHDATPTFGVFVTATGRIPFDPVNNRLFVRFRDENGVTRGLTSVAVQAGPFLTAADVEAIIRKAAEVVDATTMVIAVTDREGNVLGVFRKPNAPATVTGNFGVQVDANNWAVALARTGAFFSNNQAPLSSRTVRFISGIHFPPGITNAPNAALYGIENTNRGCNLQASFLPGQAITPAGALNGLPCRSTDSQGCGLGIATGKADVFDSNPNAVDPGGVPIFKEGVLVGGVGVTGVALDAAEFAAFTASLATPKLGPVVPAPGVIFLDGIALPFVNQTGAPPGVGPGVFPGGGRYVVEPRDSPLGAAGVPTGWLVGPTASGSLSAADVTTIVGQAIGIANQTRAAIRLPLGSRTRMMIAVTNLDGEVIGLFRMDDATIFSIDVSVAKARNAVFFSGFDRQPSDLPGVPIGTAVTARTISFGAQPLYPPGIDSSGPGPFFQLFLNDVAIPCRQGSQPPNPNQSGIVFFPGSVPLYRGGQLIGGLGVSGDGVEQDDLVTAGGATGFAPPEEIRADQVFIGGARLPFLKFPRNPFE